MTKIDILINEFLLPWKQWILDPVWKNILIETLFNSQRMCPRSLKNLLIFCYWGGTREPYAGYYSTLPTKNTPKTVDFDYKVELVAMVTTGECPDFLLVKIVM